MIDGAGKWWEVFKDNVKWNPFSVATYLNNFFNGARPIRSAVMVLALLGGMAGGGALALTVEAVNHWAISLLQTFIPDTVITSLDAAISGAGHVALQIGAFFIGAYVGNVVCGTAVKQFWRATNKLLLGSTNSFYNVTGADLEAIRKKNPELFEAPPPEPEFEHGYQRVPYWILKHTPMQWLKPGGWLSDKVPEEHYQSWYELYDLIQEMRHRKKKLKHTGRGEAQEIKHAMQDLLNNEDANALHERLLERQSALMARRYKVEATKTKLDGHLAGGVAASHDLDDATTRELSTQWRRYSQHQERRSRYLVPTTYSATPKTVGDLNKLNGSAQIEQDDVGQKLENTGMLLTKFRVGV